MRRNQLLKNTFSGHEIQHLDNGCPSLKRVHQAEVASGASGCWAEIVRIIRDFYGMSRQGVYGGPIPPGDAIFLASFIARVRPKHMVEIGVASGYSSAFILTIARELNLFSDGPFLFSYDLEEKLPNNTVGQFLEQHHADLKPRWSLNTKKTMIDILEGNAPFPPVNGPFLAFVDGGHRHPWPMVDVVGLARKVQQPFWAILQDYEMVEQWYNSAIEFGVPVNTPVRGVNIAASVWPGKKLVGTGLCYNSAAIWIDGDTDRMATYCESIRDYDYEADFPSESEALIFV